MADIVKYPFRSHLRADETTYIQHLRGGAVRTAGAGASFWFNPRTAALSEIPLDDREQALLFRARTADFQEVTVQATVVAFSSSCHVPAKSCPSTSTV